MPTEPKLLPLVEPVGARYDSLTVDSKLVNALAEKGELPGELYVYRRPAFRENTTLVAGTARGLFNWQGNIYAIVDGNIYKNGVDIGNVANSGSYSFTSCLGANPRLFLQNGTNAYTVTTADVVAPVVDVDYPAATVGGAVYLDGTTYVMNATSGIYGSDAAANDPSAWDPLNILLAQIEPTAAVHLAKQLVYVVALKQGYTEVFYDAGNATGSPLAPVQGAKMNFGCVDGRAVKDVGGDLVWVANSGEGDYSVVMVSNLKIQVISTPPIERLLTAATVGSFYSWNTKINGHRLYGVTNTTANFTLVYDVTSGIWYQWATAAGGYLPYAYSCQGTGAGTLFLHATNGKLYTLDTGEGADQGDSAFACQIFTPNFDGGTRRFKTLARMDIIGDQVDTDVTVAYSDDDYATWSSEFAVNMSLDRPSIEGFSAFTKRAFRFTHQDDAPFRFKAAELYMDVGDS